MRSFSARITTLNQTLDFVVQRDVADERRVVRDVMMFAEQLRRAARRWRRGACGYHNPVKIIVLGAGVVGVASAWYLAAAGHEVTVIERRDAAGLETSFANGGQIAAGHAEPWAKPARGAEDPALARARGRAAALPPARELGAVGVGPALPARVLAGTLRAPQPHARRPRRLQPRMPARAARASSACATTISSAASCSSPPASAISRRWRATPRRCARSACSARSSRPRECLALEPALRHSSEPVVGGVYDPKDESGDACRFTQELARIAAARGVAFRFGAAVGGDRGRAATRCSAIRLEDRAERSRGRVCGLARKLQPAAARAARHPHPGVSAEGLFDHAAARPGGAAAPRRA